MTDMELVELIRKAKGRDPDAFTELMQFCMPEMYRTAAAILKRDEDAADAIQETILICWQKLHTLRKKRYFKTWMTRILINNCYAILRKRTPFLEDMEYTEPWETDSYDLEWKEALAALDEKYRLPVLLFYGQGYKIREIARILGTPVSTIQTRLARGRKQLSVYFKGE